MDGLKEEKVERVRCDIEIDRKLIEIIRTMEKYTKRDASVLIETALKRFISSHKDYLPEDYK